MHFILPLVLLFSSDMVSSTPQKDEAPVPSYCNPLMPQAQFEAFSLVKDLCICIANKDYDSCTDAAFKANKPDASIICSVRQCQDYNWCEIMNPCAQTVPLPGIQILSCSTTEKKYPNFSSVPRELARIGLPESSVGLCLAASGGVPLPPSSKVYLDLVKSAFSVAGAIGPTP